MWWQLLILQLGFFILLLLALKKLFHGHLLSAIGRMERLQQQNLKKEEDLKRYQEAVKKECERKLSENDEEIASARRRAEAEVKTLTQGAAALLEEERRTLQETAQSKIRSTERRLEMEAARRSAAAAVTILAGTFSPEMKKILHQTLVKDLLRELTKNDGPQTRFDGGSIRVRSAYPLTPQEIEALKASVLKGAAAGVTQESDPELVAGFVISMGEVILDGSLRNRFENFIKSGTGAS